MNDQRQLREALAEPTRVCQIIVMALAMGVLMFGVIVHFVLGPGKQAEGLLTKIALGFGLVALVMQSVISRVVTAAGVGQWARKESAPVSDLMPVFQTQLLVSSALCEAAAIFNLVVYGFLEGSPWSLAMAGLMLMAIISKFPTANAVAEWCQRQARQVKENRVLGG